MEIKTKFDCGDMVYFITKDKIFHEKIIHINYVNGMVSYEFYDITKELPFYDIGRRFSFTEGLVFKTIGELIEFYVDKIEE